jgi:hypothetical protein
MGRQPPSDTVEHPTRHHFEASASQSGGQAVAGARALDELAHQDQGNGQEDAKFHRGLALLGAAAQLAVAAHQACVRSAFQRAGSACSHSRMKPASKVRHLTPRLSGARTALGVDKRSLNKYRRCSRS